MLIGGTTEYLNWYDQDLFNFTEADSFQANPVGYWAIGLDTSLKLHIH